MVRRTTVAASSSTRCQISTAIGLLLSSRMWPTSPMARANTPTPRTIFHGRPSSQQIAPMAPVALTGSILPLARSASAQIRRSSLM